MSTDSLWEAWNAVSTTEVERVDPSLLLLVATVGFCLGVSVGLVLWT